MNAPIDDIDVIRMPEGFEALRKEWRDLWARAKGRHHESFDVCWLVWRCVARHTGRSLRIVTVRRNRRLIAVWPLVRSRNRLWTILRPLGPDSADYTTVLVDPDHASEQLTESIWRAAQELCGSDIIMLPFLDCESHLHRLAMADEGLMTHREDPYAIARLSLEADWESFVASLGTLSGRKAGALRRRLERQGDVEVRMLGPGDGAENARMIDWMLASKRDWAERVDKKGQWLYSKLYRDYLVALANHVSEDDACARVLVLLLDHVPIAVCMIGVGKQSILGVMNGFDRQHGKLAPGAIAMEAWVRWALEQHYDFDLGVGSESFKPYWSKGNVSMVSSIEIANSSWGRFAFAIRRSASRLSAMRDDTRRGKRSVSPAESLKAIHAKPGETDYDRVAPHS